MLLLPQGNTVTTNVWDTCACVCMGMHIDVSVNLKEAPSEDANLTQLNLYQKSPGLPITHEAEIYATLAGVAWDQQVVWTCVAKWICNSRAGICPLQFVLTIETNLDQPGVADQVNPSVPSYSTFQMHDTVWNPLELRMSLKLLAITSESVLSFMFILYQNCWREKQVYTECPCHVWWQFTDTLAKNLFMISLLWLWILYPLPRKPKRPRRRLWWPALGAFYVLNFSGVTESVPLPQGSQLYILLYQVLPSSLLTAELALVHQNACWTSMKTKARRQLLITNHSGTTLQSRMLLLFFN